MSAYRSAECRAHPPTEFCGRGGCVPDCQACEEKDQTIAKLYGDIRVALAKLEDAGYDSGQYDDVVSALMYGAQWVSKRIGDLEVDPLCVRCGARCEPLCVECSDSRTDF